MIMVNRNTKPTRKKRLSKKKQQELAKKLESSVANVSKKGLFFKRMKNDLLKEECEKYGINFRLA